MKNFKTIIPVIFAFCILQFTGYSQEGHHRKIFEGKVEEAPSNPILQQVTYKGNSQIKDQDLIQHTFNFSVFNSERKAIEGTQEFRGILTIKEKGMMQFETLQNQPLLISYLVPENLEFNREFKIDNALLKISDFSNPGESKKEIMVLSDSALMFGFIWKTDAKPIEIKTTENISLKQEPIVTANVKAGYIPVVLKLETDGGSMSLKAGESKSFEHKGKTYLCYIEQSTYLVSDDDGGCAGGGYILKAMLRVK